MKIYTFSRIVLVFALLSSIFVLSCEKDDSDDNNNNQNQTPSCTDGIKNQDETGVDCGGSCTNTCTAPSINRKYFIQALFDNDWFTNQTNAATESTGNGGEVSWGNINGSVNDFIAIGIQLDDPFADGNDILALKGQTFTFDQDSSPNEYAFFYVDMSGVSFGTDNGSDQMNSSMTISEVTEDVPDFDNRKTYLVEGTFNCTIAKSDGTGVITVSQGDFAVRFLQSIL